LHDEGEGASAFLELISSQGNSSGTFFAMDRIAFRKSSAYWNSVRFWVCVK